MGKNPMVQARGRCLLPLPFQDQCLRRRRRFRGVLALVLAGSMHVCPAASPARLLCEWRTNPSAVRDPCPEFFWRAPNQQAARILVGRTPDAVKSSQALVWDSGWVATVLPVIEYAGPPLRNGIEYSWTVQIRADDGRVQTGAVQHFRLDVRPMPHHLPSVRTFINFGGSPDFARDWLDLCFRREAKTKGRADVLVVKYALVCTMLLPHPSTGRALSGKAAALAEFCKTNGMGDGRAVPEAMFCHFAKDTKVRLHVGAERASQPLETRLCPGWDPRNDRNGDGRVGDAEFADLVNAAAHARRAAEARIPVYYWGPPNDDFVMNVGHPLYRRFMAEVWSPELVRDWDGVYFDTVPPDVPGQGRAAAVLEYPRGGKDADQWLRDLQRLFADIKCRLPGAIVLGNAWDARPMVMDGCQSEGWETITYAAPSWKRRLDHAIDLDRRGKVQLIQYNPIFDPLLSEFGPKVPVSRSRDALYGLATYLLVHGRFTYFGFGRHPYAKVEKLWFPAMKVDFGEPLGPYELFSDSMPPVAESAKNLLVNGGFERASTKNGKLPDAWQIVPPAVLDPAVRHSGKYSVCIAGHGRGINNICKQYVHLKPHTTYTLTAWARTETVDGDPGAQVYPYEFDGVPASMMTWVGTGGWQEQRMLFRTGDDLIGRINFRMYGASGTVWFDDIRLIEGVAVRSRVFARRYTKALVLVKPYIGGPFGDDTATQHVLPTGVWRPLRADGTRAPPVRSVRLRSGEAVILAR